jgi:microcystin-dependent protein
MTVILRTILLRSSAVLAVAGGIALHSGQAQACGSDPYVGEVCFFAGTYCPNGFLPADGSVLPVNQYAALYSLIGQQYVGGNGSTTFALPDLRGRTPVGAGQGPGLTYVQQGKTRGAEGTLLTPNEIPPLNGTLGGVTATSTLPVNTTTPPGTTAALATGSTSNYLTNASAGVSLKGLYTTTAPIAGTSQATMPVNTTISGGAVVITPGPSQVAVPTLPPQASFLACVANIGIYPQRP